MMQSKKSYPFHDKYEVKEELTLEENIQKLVTYSTSEFLKSLSRNTHHKKFKLHKLALMNLLSTYNFHLATSSNLLPRSLRNLEAMIKTDYNELIVENFFNQPSLLNKNENLDQQINDLFENLKENFKKQLINKQLIK